MEDPHGDIHHKAALSAFAMLDAMQSEEALEAHERACHALAELAAQLQQAGVPSDQIASQLHAAVVQVIWRAMVVVADE